MTVQTLREAALSKSPDIMCPICYEVFAQQDTWQDMARHYWWHKLDELAYDRTRKQGRSEEGENGKTHS